MNTVELMLITWGCCTVAPYRQGSPNLRQSPGPPAAQRSISKFSNFSCFSFRSFHFASYNETAPNIADLCYTLIAGDLKGTSSLTASYLHITCDASPRRHLLKNGWPQDSRPLQGIPFCQESPPRSESILHSGVIPSLATRQHHAILDIGPPRPRFEFIPVPEFTFTMRRSTSTHALPATIAAPTAPGLYHYLSQYGMQPIPISSPFIRFLAGAALAVCLPPTTLSRIILQ